MTLYLSRAVIAKNPATTALRALINPKPGTGSDRLHDPEKGRIMDAHHRLLWALFGDTAERERDFLWRWEGQGRFLILSQRRPAADGAGLFEPPESKEFAPDLRAGDRLGFILRANATQTRKTGRLRNSGKPHTKHIDLVMDRLFAIKGQTALPDGEISQRPALRHRLATEAAGDWLASQGARSGFTLEQRPDQAGGSQPDLDVADYSVVPLPAQAGPRKGQPQFGVIDLTGHIRVAEPALLVDAIARGFGRAKAFGCGLMLIRRA